MFLPKHVDTIVSARYIAQAALELPPPATCPQNLEYILLPIPDVKILWKFMHRKKIMVPS